MNTNISPYELDCKTVGFFLKISKEICKGCCKSLTRAKRSNLTRPEARETFLVSLPRSRSRGFQTFCLTARALRT